MTNAFMHEPVSQNMIYTMLYTTSTPPTKDSKFSEIRYLPGVVNSFTDSISPFPHKCMDGWITKWDSMRQQISTKGDFYLDEKHKR